MAVAEYQVVSKPEGQPWTAVLHDWVTTVDHKKIGIMYVLLAVVFLVIGGVEAVLLRWQLWRPRNDFLGPDTFNQMFTMHGTALSCSRGSFFCLSSQAGSTASSKKSSTTCVPKTRS
jgi:cytochrome c oxidase subunit I